MVRKRRSPIAFRKRSSNDSEDKQKVLRAAVYVRVSTEEQAKTGYSIAAQIEKLEGTAQFNKWILLPAYVDDGYSGKDLNRPAMRRLLEDARKKKFDLVLVFKLDRFSRKLSDLVSLGEMFERIDVGIRSITEPFDTTTPPGKLLFNMLGSFAQFERELIGERTRMGLRRRLKEGKWNGLPPFGYRVSKDGVLEVRPEEVPFVRRVFRLLTEENIGVKLITRTMRKEDKTTRRRKTGWQNTTVWQMLTNPVYAGFMIMDGKPVKARHEVIISEELFQRTQEMLKARTAISSEALHSPNILTGLVKCGRCGKKMTTGKGKGKYYYACASRRRNGSCDMKYVPARALEDSITHEIKEIARHPKVIEQYLRKHRKECQGAAKRLSDERKALQKRLEAVERSKADKVRWMVENVPSKEVSAEVSREIEEQIDRAKELRGRLAGIDSRLRDLAGEDAKAEGVSATLLKALDSFESWRPSRKRLLMQCLVREIVVSGKLEAKVVFTLPLTAPPKQKPGSKKTPVLDEKTLGKVSSELLAAQTSGYPLGTNWLRR
ncbi:MAG: recombinase family protein [Elusimicrobiota bacterium]